jgi:two-component system chemotaxis response regulator CheY
MKVEKPVSLEMRNTLRTKTYLQPQLERAEEPAFKITNEHTVLNGSVVMPHGRTPIRTIIVDDSADMRGAVQALLESHHKLEVVGVFDNGRVALEQTRVLQPDLILTDYSMPGMNGVELADAVHSQYPNTKVIVTSAHERQYLEMATVGLGAHVFISKTRLAEELLQEVKRMFPTLGSRSTGEHHAQQG